MRTQVDKTYEDGFTLTEQELRRISNVALKQMNQVVGENNAVITFRLGYKNDFTAELTSVEEVISESNGGAWEIQSLTIFVEDKKDKDKDEFQYPSIDIKFARKFKDAPYGIKFLFENAYSYSIKGEDRDWVYITSSQIEDILAKIRQFSLRLFLIKSLFRLFLPVWLIFIFLFLLLIFFVTPSRDKPIFFMTGYPINDLFAVIIGAVLLLIGIWAGIYFFPSYNFKWGDNLTYLEKKHSTGKFIIVVIVIGILINIIAAPLATYFIGIFGVSH